MSKADAETLLTSNTKEDGEFIVRQREPKSRDFVLVVMYNGKPTHHLMTKSEQGTWTVNKKQIVNEPELVKVCETKIKLSITEV